MNRFIVVTGAAGFIGSDLVGYLNGKGYSDLILVDEFGDAAKEPNLAGKKFAEKVERVSCRACGSGTGIRLSRKGERKSSSLRQKVPAG